jgi:hypothetical protein
MRYDDFDIELAKKRGAPDPEENLARANFVVELILKSVVEYGHLDTATAAEAKGLLETITDSVLRGDLETLIDCRSSWSCITG